MHLREVEQTFRLLRMGKCRLNGLSCANFGPPEAELNSFLQPPATSLWVVEGWGRALRNPWQMGEGEGFKLRAKGLHNLGGIC